MGEVLCEFRNDDGSYFGAGPRTLARAQLHKLADMGLNMMSSCEVSFRTMILSRSIHNQTQNLTWPNLRQNSHDKIKYL